MLSSDDYAVWWVNQRRADELLARAREHEEKMLRLKLEHATDQHKEIMAALQELLASVAQR